MNNLSTSPLHWCYLLLAIVLGNLFGNQLAKQLELSQLNVRVLKRQVKKGTRRPQPTIREKRRMAELAHVLKQYMAWYNHERPRQGLDGEYIDRLDEVGDGAVEVTERLSGLLKHYSRAA